ncbi:hypothetical protein V9N52_004184, partial [Vibrio navarrensis]
MYTLHFKSLIRLWDRTQFATIEKRKHRPFDGQYVLNALFSIEAFSTNSTSKNQSFCREALTLFLNRLRTARLDIKTEHQAQQALWGDMTLVPFIANKHRLDLTIPDAQRCRCTGLLVKVFSAADAYLMDLHRAHYNDEIKEEDFNQAQKTLLR